jgi:type II secretory pathway component PulF
MATATLSQFITLHDQLVALVKAGVPIQLGLPIRGSGAAVAFERIGATVARRVGEGASVQEALEDPRVPAAYRSVAQLALTSGDLATALSGANHMAEARDDSWYALRMSLRYPLVICCLAYVGIVLFCLFLVPTLESMYENMRIPAGSGLSAVTALRRTLPYWVAIPPIGLVLLAIWTRWTSSGAIGTARATGVLAWLPGTSKIIREQRWTRFAELLASHLDAGAPLPEGLRMAAAAWENDALQRATLAHAASLDRGQAPSGDNSFAAGLPPFLRWAICHADDAVGRTRALRMAADAYRESACRRIQRLRVVAPIVTGLVIGGGVVLLYALALFVPVVQMIEGLAG